MTERDDPVEVAVRALRHRDRSRQELDERLARAGVDDDTRAEALDRLERVGYVDDERVARARADALAARGYGDDWIRRDLHTRGIAPGAAAGAVAALEPELERARGLVARQGASRRTAAQLGRKGFGGDAIEAALGAVVGGDDD